MASMWVKNDGIPKNDGNGGVSNLSQEEEEDNDEDIWDDTALIEAYDKAVSSFKKSLDGKGNKETAQGKRQKHRKGSKNSKAKLSSPVRKKSWNVGDKCNAVYYEDGLFYDGIIIEVHKDAETCTVKFDYYNNVEVVHLKDIYERDHKNHHVYANYGHDENRSSHSTSKKRASRSDDLKSELLKDKLDDGDQCSGHSQERGKDLEASWTIGDVCVAAHPQTGHYEEAVITSLESDSCCLTFIRSNLKERIPLVYLRRKSSKRTHCQHHCTRHRSKGSHHDKKDDWVPDPFPPFHLPNDLFSQPEHIIPPPPPPFALPSVAQNGSDEAFASMLMSWYMVGYHTGYYQGLRCNSTSHLSPRHPTHSDQVMDTYSESSSRP